MAARIAAALSEEGEPYEAFAEASARVATELGSPPDLAVTFACGQHAKDPDAVVEAIADELEPAHLIGGCAGGVIATGREVEHGSAAVVWGAVLPGADIGVGYLTAAPGVEPGEADSLPPMSERTEALLTVADPFGFAVGGLLDYMFANHSGVPVIGGLAAGSGAGPGPLFCEGEWFEGGAVVCALEGASVIPCVSQGATPVGPEMTVTGASGRTITELASKPAMERIGEVITELGEDERALAGQGLMLGVVIEENRPEHVRGDFLVRPIVAADADSGSVMLGESVRVGQTVRLHVRDAGTADRDLREALGLQVDAFGAEGAAGALLFSCTGRGTPMFGQPDHDASVVDQLLGAPVGGFFCAGEIGPVAGRSFLHGFTATMAVFGAG